MPRFHSSPNISNFETWKRSTPKRYKKRADNFSPFSRGISTYVKGRKVCSILLRQVMKKIEKRIAIYFQIIIHLVIKRYVRLSDSRISHPGKEAPKTFLTYLFEHR